MLEYNRIDISEGIDVDKILILNMSRIFVMVVMA